MPLNELMGRSKVAAQQARKTLAAAEPGSTGSGLAAVAGSLDEIGANVGLLRRLRDIDGRLDDRQRHLRSLRQDTDRPREVRRRQVAELEAEVAQLKAARRDLEDEVRATSLPAQSQTLPHALGHAGAGTDAGATPGDAGLTSAPGETTESRRDSSPHSAARRKMDRPDDEDIKSRAAAARTKGSPEDAWVAGLPKVPLTDDGWVDGDALKPKQVYRMPESAGGGLGRWTNGLFYNYDGNADWAIRSVADLDAHSGVSGQPTVNERREFFFKWIMAGGGFIPAVFLEKPDIAAFNRKNTEGLWAAQGDDQVSFRLGDGPVFLTLPDDAAAVLVRNWGDFGPRVNLLARLFADDLSPEQMRRLVEAEVYKGIPESERDKPSAMNPDGTMYAFDDPFGGQRRVAEYRLHAFDEMVDGIRDGASDEEVAQLIRDFQEIMLPELMGAGRFLKEFVKDMAPGLNNVRSGFHFWNDLREIKEEWREGDIAGLAGNSALLLLDGLGLVPIVGSAFAPMRNVLKRGGRAIVKTVPYLDGLVAEAQLWRHGLQWANRRHKIDPSRIFGTVFDKLSPDIQKKVRSKTNFALGHAGEEFQQGLLNRMDSAAHGQTHVNIPGHLQPNLGGRKFRRYDGLARDATAILVHDFMEWTGRLTGRRWNGFQPEIKHYEFKAGAGHNSLQNLIDAFANNNPGILTDVFGNAVERVERARIYPEQIPMDLAIRHAEARFAQLVANNVITATTSRELLDAMRVSYERGTKFIGLFDYAGLYVNLLAAAGHRSRSMSSENAT